MKTYELVEIDWNGEEITDNDGAETIEEAIAMAIRMCENGRERVHVDEVDEDFPEYGSIEVGVAIAPSSDWRDLRDKYYDSLRMVLFGLEDVHHWSDEELADPDRFVRDAAREDLESTGCEDVYAISNNAQYYEFSSRPDSYVPEEVYTRQAYEDALFWVFNREMEKAEARGSDE